MPLRQNWMYYKILRNLQYIHNFKCELKFFLNFWMSSCNTDRLTAKWRRRRKIRSTNCKNIFTREVAIHKFFLLDPNFLSSDPFWNMSYIVCIYVFLKQWFTTNVIHLEYNFGFNIIIWKLNVENLIIISCSISCSII